MSRTDIFIFTAIMCFVAICFLGISGGASWSMIATPQQSWHDYVSNGVAAFAGLVGAFICAFLSCGSWNHPDHDAVLGRC